ncbi:hypothetical protein [Burkholderia gladioli]|uniref:hypothetical protein n=1 Tax=Burkholderia gladioli TaxID=28095 RepID=UPI00164093BC|nr:hypothetical protein [Burkholderia gladioli]
MKNIRHLEECVMLDTVGFNVDDVNADLPTTVMSMGSEGDPLLACNLLPGGPQLRPPTSKGTTSFAWRAVLPFTSKTRMSLEATTCE